MAITKIQSESLNLADTYDFTGTVTGAGGVNTPAFSAYISSNQSIPNTTFTKIQFNIQIQIMIIQVITDLLQLLLVNFSFMVKQELIQVQEI